MKEGAQSLVGSAIGCAIVGAAGVFALAVAGLLALAFPLTVSVVVGTLLVLAFTEWRRRKSRKPIAMSAAPDADPANDRDREGN